MLEVVQPQTSHRCSQYLQNCDLASAMNTSQQGCCRGETNNGGKTYPMCQKTGDGIRHRRCDYRILEKLLGNDVYFVRLPILCPAAIRVHDEDNKNPRFSCCESPTDSSPPIARGSFRGMNHIDRKELTRGPWHSHASQRPIEGRGAGGPHFISATTRPDSSCSVVKPEKNACVSGIVSQAKNCQPVYLPSADPFVIEAAWSIVPRSVVGIEGLTAGGRKGCSILNAVA